jgi:hypothetical protein
LCRGVPATKNSPPSRTKRTLPIKLSHLTHPYHLSIGIKLFEEKAFYT